MNAVVHFEMPAKDRDRVKKFYENAFGWQMTQLGPQMGNYILATTTPTDETTRIPREPGAINGGFFEYNDKDPGLRQPSITISVADIRKAMADVEKAGGKVIGGRNPGEPDDIPGVGLFVAFEDSEGNRVSLLQPSR